MPYDFYGKKKKSDGDKKAAARNKNAFLAKTKPVTRRQPKRPVSY